MFSVNITDLGLTLLLMGYFPVFVFLKYILRGNVPEKLPSESYAKVIAVKVVFTILLAVMASGGGGGGRFGFISTITALPASLGGGYFITSMVLDMFFLALLWRGEFYGAAKMVMFNVIYVPFLTFLAVLYGLFVEQGRTIRMVREDLSLGKGAVVLGYAVKLMRRVRKPVRGYMDVEVRPTNDIRPLPIEHPVGYSPVIGERDLNPHVIIAGSSGTGKTTTIYNVVRGLAKNFPVVFIDVKGDVSRALLNDGVDACIVAVSQVGLNPFAKVVENETERGAVEDLMGSISVVEPVGSRQEHFIRMAYAEIYHSGSQLAYTTLVGIIDRMENESVSITSPESRRGPGTRDALFGISSKLKDLSEYLRDDGVSVKAVLERALDGNRESDFPVAVFNLEGISEKARAIILELILRKIAKYVSSRGPLAYQTETPLVLVVDEAYLVTRPMERSRRRSEENRSILEEIARVGRSYGVALILVTQRLCDIADGIRQNCDKWVIFRTSSPDDLHVLGIDDSILEEVVTQLDKGYAYIRIVTGRRIEGIRYTSDITAMTVGYLFRMERQPLKMEARGGGKRRVSYKYLTVCYRCKFVIKDPQYCPFCGQAPLPARPASPSGWRPRPDRHGEQPAVKPQQTTSQELNTNSQKVDATIVDWEEVRRNAIVKCPEGRETLEKLTIEQVADFLTNFPNVNEQLYSELGLMKKVENRCRLRPAGGTLLNVYKEVVGK